MNWKGVPVSEKSNLRLIILGILIFSLMATLISRLYFLQIMEGDEYRAAAASNTVREVAEPAVRGIILDQAGRPLVSNRTSIVVTIDRQELKQQAKSGDQVRLHEKAATSDSQLDKLGTLGRTR